ncbi:E3 ubiquitin-protein ligase Topors isoform X2 [Procambarus clarkii]|uniref:E3 ubiquitin-protein ligase Topors isoform X2 n=1 Tax=Procambarus clarkii TaxID=6728 RepID=UPI001E6723F8|nr:E3 ubiquitin-protein ligase Topors-like isoform X2 [Procambarus clarkii]
MSSPREKLQGADACPVMNSSMSACTSEKKSPSGSRTPERPPSDNSPISDDTCPICLSHITDKCVANSCLHGFCLVCLKEWSKQKAVCPLCKLSFTTIMYDIKSESEYKEWKVPRPEPLERSQGIANFQEFLDAERRRFFGYRTTNFPGAATLRRQHPGRTHAIPDAIPSGPRERRHSRYYLRGSSMFRLSVYLNNVWVQPIADITGRYRQSSPDLYREQPALTHRLVPWVNRELAALLPSSRIGVVLGEVMDLIERYAINSREFRRAMQEHLGRRTNHFVHEFYHFARSPYDMVGHDNAAQYVPRYGFNNEDSSTSSSDDSDAVVEVDMSGNPVIVSAGEARQGTTTPGAVEREETLTHEGSVVISSDNFSSSESNEPTSLMSGLAQTQPDFSETHNPEPPESLYMNRLIGRARDFLSTINEGASTSRPAGSSGMQSAANSTLKTEVSSDSEQSDACIVIEEVKKRHKTPEIINLDSDEGEQHAPPLKENDNHWKKKLSKDFIKDKNSSVSSVSSRQHKVKEKQKPTLKRTNFPLHISQSSCSSTSNRKSAKEDHSYCNEHDSASIEASSSNDHNGSIQTSSIEISLKWHKSSKNHDSTFSVKKKDKQCASLTDASSSNDDSSLPNLYCKKRKQKDKGKKASNKRNLTAKSRSTGNTVGSLSSRNRMKSPSRELNASPKRMKKDHRSKIKSSSRFSSCHDAHARNSFTPSNSSESSEESWCPSDRLWTPPSNKTEGSSSQDQCWDSHSKQSSGDSKDSCFREWKDEHSSSKSKHSNKKRKRKSKDRRKSEKSKKSKKSKHKKKGKSKKSVYKCSSSDSETDFSEQSSKRQKKRKRRLADSSSRSESESIEIGSRKRARKTMILSDTSSTSHVSPD